MTSKVAQKYRKRYLIGVAKHKILLFPQTFAYRQQVFCKDHRNTSRRFLQLSQEKYEASEFEATNESRSFYN